jgi:hypothetical protein
MFESGGKRRYFAENRASLQSDCRRSGIDKCLIISLEDMLVHAIRAHCRSEKECQRRQSPRDGRTLHGKLMPAFITANERRRHECSQARLLRDLAWIFATAFSLSCEALRLRFRHRADGSINQPARDSADEFLSKLFESDSSHLGLRQTAEYHGHSLGPRVDHRASGIGPMVEGHMSLGNLLRHIFLSHHTHFGNRTESICEITSQRLIDMIERHHQIPILPVEDRIGIRERKRFGATALGDERARIGFSQLICSSMGNGK